MTAGEMTMEWAGKKFIPRVAVEPSWGEKYRLRVEAEMNGLGGLLGNESQMRRLEQGWREGDKDLRQYEVIRQAEKMYKLAQMWVRNDYRGFAGWAKESLGMDEVEVDSLVRGLNVGDDEVLVRREVEWWRGRMGQWQGERGVKPGERTLLMLASAVGSGDSGAESGGGDGDDFKFDLGGSGGNLQPDDSDGEKPVEGEEDGAREGELAVVSERRETGSSRKSDSRDLPDSMKAVSMAGRRWIGVGCLVLTLSCCLLPTLYMGGIIAEGGLKDLQDKDKSGQLVDPEFAGVGGIKHDAEMIAGNIFWEEGWENDPNKIEDLDRGSIRLFLSNYDNGNAKYKRAYGESMLDELERQGLSYSEGIGPWQNITGFDEARLRQTLASEEYSEEDIDSLAKWLHEYIGGIEGSSSVVPPRESTLYRSYKGAYGFRDQRQNIRRRG